MPAEGQLLHLAYAINYAVEHRIDVLYCFIPYHIAAITRAQV